MVFRRSFADHIDRLPTQAAIMGALQDLRVEIKSSYLGAIALLNLRPFLRICRGMTPDSGVNACECSSDWGQVPGTYSPADGR